MASRTRQFVTFLALTALLVVPVASAGTLMGAAPASVRFESLLRESTVERTVTFQNQGDDPVTLSLQLEGPQADWLDLERSSVKVGPGERVPVALSAHVPGTAANGEYEARLRATPTNSHQAEGSGASSAIVQEMVVPIRMNVTDTQSLVASVDALHVPDLESGGQLWLEATLTNAGNVDAAPEVRVQVLDESNGEELAAFDATFDPVAPSEGAVRRVALGDLDLEPGAYRAHITLALPGGELRGQSEAETVFEVLPPGSLSLAGEVTAATAGDDPAVDELVPIQVTFHNAGDRPVLAKLRLTVHHAGSVVDVIEADPLRAGAGEEVTFETFFRPDRPGVHAIEGVVNFDGELAEVPALSLDVAEPLQETSSQDEGEPSGGFFIPLPAPALIVAALAAAAVAVPRRWRP